MQTPAAATKTARKKLNPVDSTLILILIMLLLAGLLVLFSATFYTAQDRGDPLSEVRHQLLGIALGAAAMLVTSRIDRKSVV